MRVMFVIARLNNQGPVNQLYSLIKGMIDKEIRIEVVTIYSEIEDTRYQEFINLGVQIDSLNVQSKYGLLSARRELCSLIEARKPNVIHSMTLPADLLVGFSIVDKSKWCITMHCDIYKDYLTRFSNVYAKVCIKVHEHMLKQARSIICCSEAISRSYISKFGEKVSVIKNGIDISDIDDVLNLDEEKLKKRLGLNLNKKIAVVVGSIDERKNSIYIVESYLKMKNKDALQLVFLGEGPLFEECRKIAKGAIDFRGKVDNVPLYLRCADLYISASKSEGLPLSVIEAGCYGKNMVLSDICPHKELVQKYCGSCIALINTDSRSILSNLLDEAVLWESDSREEISAYFIGNFKSSRMCESYYNLYGTL